MTSVDVMTVAGELAGTIELDAALFGAQPNVPVMHQVVTAQLAAARRGTQSTRTRAEVSGGGAKPYRQKGTGRARQGSTRAPHWSGGGIALGPKPRSYRQRTPKKMVRLALASALSDRLAGGHVVVVDSWGFSEPRTKDGIAALAALELSGKVLLVVEPDDEVAIKCFRNLPDVQLLVTTELNAYDVLCSDVIVFSTGVLPGERGVLVEASADAKAKAAEAKAARAPQPKPAVAPAPRRRRRAPEPAEEAAGAPAELDEEPADAAAAETAATEAPVAAEEAAADEAAATAPAAEAEAAVVAAEDAVAEDAAVEDEGAADGEEDEA